MHIVKLHVIVSLFYIGQTSVYDTMRVENKKGRKRK
nr:hypothetical protein YSBCXYJI_YSBCXYJI_CDS_0160 [Caudoviricetes sp.]